jgi:glucose/arabinose dehydrogenase
MTIDMSKSQELWTFKRLTWTPSYSWNPLIAIDSSDNIYVAWRDLGEIFLKKSSDGGTSWTRKRLTWNPGTSYLSSMAIDSSDNIYIVWSDYHAPGNSEIYLKKSTDYGETWTSRRLSWNSGESWQPFITIDGSDNIYVAWADNTPGNFEIFLKKSTDHGETWASRRISRNSGDSFFPSMATNSHENIYVVWEDETPGNFEIYLKKSTDHGETWTSRRLSWDPEDSLDPSIAIDSFNNIYIVWGNETPEYFPEVFLKKSTDSGETWTLKRLTWNSDGSGYPSMAIDSSDNIYVVWEDTTPGNSEIFLKKSTDYGEAWTLKRLTRNSGSSTESSIAIDSLDNIYVVWEDNTPGNFEIFFKKSDECSTWPEISLNLLYSGFTSPVYATNADDGSNRLFIVEQQGKIILIKDSSIITTPFLDITSQILSGGEKGLFSVAFSPDYSDKGYFYVSYTRKPDGASVVSRFMVDPENADGALASSEEIILTVDQPYSNHNGGQIAFGLDNYLYIGFGDGGSGGDPEGNGQKTDTLLGKILRIDVESGESPYVIPTNNPFVGQANYRPEIWALGLRNPWRFSFDRRMGNLFTADVGQNSWEEINFQSKTSLGGENYGWNIMEGAHCYNSESCDQSNLILPVYEYNHSQGRSITGGYVYRGSNARCMQGIYFFGDYVNGKIWGLKKIRGEWQGNLLLDTGLNISSFGESEDGRLLVIDINGNIYEIREK